MNPEFTYKCSKVKIFLIPQRKDCTMNSNFRLYSFMNFYLSQIQQGIQTAHIVHELFIKYEQHIQNEHPASAQSQKLHEWATNDKTIIVLNGGAAPDIKAISQVIGNMNLTPDLPWASFYEDAGLNFCITGVGVIVPEYMYNSSLTEIPYGAEGGKIPAYVFTDIDSQHVFIQGTYEFDFIEIMKTKRLA